jgi:hypothetical protein
MQPNRGGALLIPVGSWKDNRSFIANLLVQPWIVPMPRVWLVILFLLLIKKKSIQKKVEKNTIYQFCMRWKEKIDSYEKQNDNFRSRNALKTRLKQGLVVFAAIEFYRLYTDYKRIAHTKPSFFPKESWWDDMKTSGGGGGRPRRDQKWKHLIPYIVSFCFALSLPIFGTQKLKDHLIAIVSRFPFCKVFASKIHNKLETDPLLNNISPAPATTQKLFLSDAYAAVKDILVKKSTKKKNHPTKTQKHYITQSVNLTSKQIPNGFSDT